MDSQPRTRCGRLDAALPEHSRYCRHSTQAAEETRATLDLSQIGRCVRACLRLLSPWTLIGAVVPGAAAQHWSRGCRRSPGSSPAARQRDRAASPRWRHAAVAGGRRARDRLVAAPAGSAPTCRSGSPARPCHPLSPGRRPDRPFLPIRAARTNHVAFGGCTPQSRVSCSQPPSASWGRSRSWSRSRSS
jgi:hypothetical protein